MMIRFISTVGRSLTRATGILANYRMPTPFPGPSSLGLSSLSSQKNSVEASRLKKELPEFWISKMKTIFNWVDADGDGYLTGKDFDRWTTEMPKLFPDMTEEQKKLMLSNINHLWGIIFGADEKGPDFKMTEDMYLERAFWFVCQEGAEDMIRQTWSDIFTVMDINQDGVISKAEHYRFFEAWKTVKDPIRAAVAFAAIDVDMDGVITRDEYVNAALENLFNFTDETKGSKHFYGPLAKIRYT